MDDLLVLWDLDGTLLSAGGVGGDLYNTVFGQLFGRSLEAFAIAPMAGRTDRAIILETLALAGVPEPQRYVEPFIAGMSAQVPTVREAVAARGRALPGAAAALSALASARSMAALLVMLGPAGGAAGGAAGAAAGAAAGGAVGAAAGARARSASDGDGGAAGRVFQSVLTGNIRPMAEAKLAALGLRNGLELRIGAYGDDHELRAELVRVARRRAAAVHGRSASAFAGAGTVVIGDTPLDVEAALATGARAVGVATGGYSAGELASAGAHAVLPDLTDTTAVLRALL